MKKIHLLCAAGLTVAAAQTASANVLVAGWNFNEAPDEFTGNTISANFSDLYAGRGIAANGAAGTMYADGSFGSSVIDNSSKFSLNPTGPDIALNYDTPGLGVDEMEFAGPGESANKLNIADGGFGAVPAADPSGEFIVFAAFAPTGFTFDAGDYTLSYAIGAEGLGTNTVNLAYSLNGINYTAAGSVVVGADALGTPVTITAAGDETQLFYRMQMPDIGFGNLGLDNVQITGPAPVPEPSVYAAIFGALGLAHTVIRRRRK